MPHLLSDIARRKKIEYFLADLPKDAKILEVGCGGGWVGEHFRNNGYTGYQGLDVLLPADIIGDVNEWKSLGLQPASYDAVIAFEVVEHVDCWQAMHDLLKPSGRAMVTTPIPHMDWAMKILEKLGLNQTRTSPHTHLTYLDSITIFSKKHVKKVGGLAQWAIFTK